MLKPNWLPMIEAKTDPQTGWFPLPEDFAAGTEKQKKLFVCLWPNEHDHFCHENKVMIYAFRLRRCSLLKLYPEDPLKLLNNSDEVHLWGSRKT